MYVCDVVWGDVRCVYRCASLPQHNRLFVWGGDVLAGSYECGEHEGTEINAQRKGTEHGEGQHASDPPVSPPEGEQDTGVCVRV